MTKLKVVEAHVIEETKILDLFQKEFKANIDTFLQKKNVKKMMAEKDLNEFT